MENVPDFSTSADPQPQAGVTSRTLTIASQTNEGTGCLRVRNMVAGDTQLSVRISRASTLLNFRQ